MSSKELDPSPMTTTRTCQSVTDVATTVLSTGIPGQPPDKPLALVAVVESSEETHGGALLARMTGPRAQIVVKTSPLVVAIGAHPHLALMLDCLTSHR